jgi:PTS system mannose-specific IIA component
MCSWPRAGKTRRCARPGPPDFATPSATNVINIVIVSHGNLGSALIRSAELISGPAEGVYAVALLPDDSPEGFARRLAATMDALSGQEALVLIDLLGGTPYNVAARQVLNANVECVTGVNLPMLLELMMTREGASLPDLAASIARVGRESIRNLGPLLRPA